MVGFVVWSYWNIRKVSSDQRISPVETLQPKLPVRLSRWASARLASLRRKAFVCSRALPMPPKKYCAARRRNLEVWVLIISITLRRGSRARNAFVETERLFPPVIFARLSLQSTRQRFKAADARIDPRGRAPDPPGKRQSRACGGRGDRRHRRLLCGRPEKGSYRPEQL